MTFRRPSRAPRAARPRTARPAAGRRRTAGALLATTGLLAGLGTALAPAAADAAAVTNHNPVGGVFADRTATATGITVHGWAVDPDLPTANATVYALVDGVTRASGVTALPDKAVTTKYHAGPTPDVRLTVPVPTGKHTVCLAVHNTGPGTDVIVGCLATPLGRKATTAEIAAHSPQGLIRRASASASAVHVTGFVTDPDLRSKHLTVVLYVDGRSTVTASTVTTAAGAPAGSGAHASFDIVAPVSVGTHQTCVWAVNVGWGSNSFLGCTAVDTRGSQPLAAGSPAPTILPAVLAEAKKHIGQPYVWGAVGPKKFDCSGLVLYTYKKYGVVTPRISEDQARAARLIPASHAQPGDLVFYHDTEGDVYHVGIYLSPGRTVAAIDEQEGVNYQTIWDPSTATYGSFTHL